MYANKRDLLCVHCKKEILYYQINYTVEVDNDMWVRKIYKANSVLNLKAVLRGNQTRIRKKLNKTL